MTAILAVQAGSYPSYPVTISDQSISNSAPNSVVSASYILNSDGTVQNHGSTVMETWLQTGTAGDYEARVTLTSGTLSFGTTGSWVNLGTTRVWSKTDNAQDDVPTSCTFTVEIRRTGSGTAADSASITLTANAQTGGGPGG